MIGKIRGSKKLEELVKHNKADDSVLNTIKEIEGQYKDAKKKLKQADKDIETVEQNISIKRKERLKTAIYRVKEFSNISKEISDLKKQYKQLLNDREQLEDTCIEKEDINSKIEVEIENQYAIYQENEIYIRAVEKVEKNKIDLSGEFYKRYFKHVNHYLNSVYSIDKETRLTEPNPEDLATLLKVLKKNEKIENNKKDRANKVADTKKTAKKSKKVIVLNTIEPDGKAKKTTTKKRATKTDVVNQ